MATRATTRAVRASRAAIDEINAFMINGTPLRPYLRAAVVRDEERARKLAEPAIRDNNLLPEIMRLIEDEIPAALFENDESKLDAWIEHRGIKGATSPEIAYLLMSTDRWKREAVTHNA